MMTYDVINYEMTLHDVTNIKITRYVVIHAGAISISCEMYNFIWNLTFSREIYNFFLNLRFSRQIYNFQQRKLYAKERRGKQIGLSNVHRWVLLMFKSSFEFIDSGT